MSPRSQRFAVPVALVLLLACGASAAEQDDRVARLKQLQAQILLNEPAEKLEKLERRQTWLKKAKKLGTKKLETSKRAGPGQRGKPLRKPTDLGAAPTVTQPPRLTTSRLAAPPPNRLVNDPTGEPWGSCQSEVSIAAHGNNVVAAWNDGQGIYPLPEEDTQGYAYSTDGGLTWTDGGRVPNGGQFLWSSDPVVVVNPSTGAFYFSALYDAAGENGIAVVKGTFNGASFSWSAPMVVQSVPNSSNLLDKEWMAVDPASGNLYVTYSNFVFVGGVPVSNSIQISRSVDDGQNWSTPVTLSSSADAGLVQGSRPAVGPDGELYVVWHAIGQSSGPDANSPFGRDFLRIRKSTDGGQNFGAQITADSLFSNFSSGAPGFNRGIGITFPGIAVDHTSGPDRGRVYLTWNESLNFFNDQPPTPGQDPARSEIEGNNGPNLATAFTPGYILRGVISTTGNPGDLDYWKWNATQGETTIFWLDSLAGNLDAAFRIFCADGSTLLAFSQNGYGGQGLLVFTAPTTGTYFMRVASYRGLSTGGYRVLTYTNFPQNDRARDHRDIFVKSSANGTAWGATRRVNDSPGYFDDWLPEVQVDDRGRVFVAHYDWRDATNICGGGSNVYLYRSDDAGVTWIPGTPMTDFTTNWSVTASDLLPNQGDYIGLFARDSTIFVAWADGRDAPPANGLTDPDVYMTSTTLTCQSAPVALVGSTLVGDTIVVTWSAPQGLQATLQKRIGTAPFVNIGPFTADANDQIVFTDPDVALGFDYTYRLEVTGFCQSFVGTVVVNVPGAPEPPFGIALIRPNPTPHDVFVQPLITGAAPAYLELLDISGRQIVRMQVPCPAGLYCLVNLTEGLSVKSGLYFVRLVEGSRESVKRVSIFP
jgi:hypothetical protein